MRSQDVVASSSPVVASSPEQEQPAEGATAEDSAIADENKNQIFEQAVVVAGDSLVFEDGIPIDQTTEE